MLPTLSLRLCPLYNRELSTKAAERQMMCATVTRYRAHLEPRVFGAPGQQGVSQGSELELQDRALQVHGEERCPPRAVRLSRPGEAQTQGQSLTLALKHPAQGGKGGDAGEGAGGGGL